VVDKYSTGQGISLIIYLTSLLECAIIIVEHNKRIDIMKSISQLYNHRDNKVCPVMLNTVVIFLAFFVLGQL
jgi:hypothetical protein